MGERRSGYAGRSMLDLHDPEVWVTSTPTREQFLKERYGEDTTVEDEFADRSPQRVTLSGTSKPKPDH